MTDTIAILQARTSSRRLPAESAQGRRRRTAAAPDDRTGAAGLQGRPHRRGHQHGPYGRSTSRRSPRRINVDCFRGSLDDVLDRLLPSRVHFKARAHRPADGRLRADRPGPHRRVIADYHRGTTRIAATSPIAPFQSDWISRSSRSRRLDGRVEEASAPYDREHVTPFLRRNPLGFVHGVVKDVFDRSEQRWVVDEPADLDFVRDCLRLVCFPSVPPSRARTSLNCSRTTGTGRNQCRLRTVAVAHDRRTGRLRVV